MAPVVLRDLVLLATSDQGDVPLPGLALSATDEAVSVSGPAGQVLRSWSWSEIAGLDADDRGEGADGRERQVLSVDAADRRHRFLVGAPDLSVFLAATARWRPEGPEGPEGGRPAVGPAHARRRRSGRRAAAGGGGGGGGATISAGTAAGTAAVMAVVARATRVVTGAVTRTATEVARPVSTTWGQIRIVRLRRARHARTLRVRPVPACLGAIALIAGGATFGSIGTGGAGATPAAAGGGAGGAVSIMSRMDSEYASRVAAVDLPPATTAPAPAPPSLAGSPALASHEVFGFAPYWTLPEASGFDVSDLTTIAYFSVDVNGDGSIETSGPGWNGYESQDLANLITRAHAAGARVVLTATCFGQSALNQLTSEPTAQKRLAGNLVQLVSAKNLDGVNLDFEGQGNSDQTGLNALVAQVSGAVRAANPHWQVTMDTYASSAGDPGGFYDISGLAPSVDAFFVMAYDMNGTSPSPTAALTGSGFTDLEALEQYTAVVPPSKVILGVPYYGYDWPTTGPDLGASATGPKTPLSYAQIVAADHPVYWDAATQTAWTSYLVGTQWHQTWFDNPTSLALKAQLADVFHVAGVGVWALGMDGNSPAMLAALLGKAPVVKDFVAGPGATTTTTAAGTTTSDPGTNYSFAGVWNQSAVTLSPVVPASLPDDGEGVAAGVLTGFSTDDPADGCLASGGPLAVNELIGEPDVYLVTATTPGDCADGWWTFTSDAGAGGGSGGGGTTTTSTTSSTTTTTTSSTTTTSTTTTSSTTTSTTTTTDPPG